MVDTIKSIRARCDQDVRLARMERDTEVATYRESLRERTQHLFSDLGGLVPATSRERILLERLLTLRDAI